MTRCNPGHAERTPGPGSALTGRDRAQVGLQAAQADRRPQALAFLGGLEPGDLAGDAEACAAAGAAWAMLGERGQAAPFLNQDWSCAPADAASLAGAALLKLGAAEAAVVALRRALDAGTGDRRSALVNLGQACMLLGRSDEALHLLEEARTLAGESDARVFRALAEARAAVGDLEGALRELPERSLDERDVGARCGLLAAMGRHDEAAVLLRDRITEAPEPRPLLIIAAELAESRGRSFEAIGHLKRALERSPEDLPLLARLAAIAAKHPEMRRRHAAKWAARAIELADARNPQDPREMGMARLAHAAVLEHSGEYQAAESAYRQALGFVPDLPGALSGLGHLLLETGRVAEAVQCFEDVRRVAPLTGWSHLIHARQIPDDPLVLERIETAARRPSIEGPVSVGLLFTLSQAYERQGDHARAFSVAREANEASRSTLTYSPAAHRFAVDREISVFSADFVEARRHWGHPTRVPVFVLGMPRSGTTLVEQILASHSRVHGAGELGQIGEQITRMEAWERKLGSGLRYPDCLWDLTETECRGYASRLLEELQLLAPAATHIIDKLPHNFQHIGLIRLLYPNAVIFHCRREPRDIAISNYLTDYAAKSGGMGFAYDLEWIGEQLVDHERLMRHWHAVFPGEVFEVRYEELVEDTEGWARRMIDHLALEWEPGVLDFQRLDRPVKTASVWQVRQPVYTSSKARWRRHADQLGPLEVALSRVPPMPDPMPAPRIPPGLFAEAMAHLRAGHAEQARTSLERLLEVRPLHAAANHFLGAALLQLGRLEPACEAMRRSVELLTHHASWFENLAGAEAAAGNEALARLATERAQRLRGRESGNDSREGIVLA